MPIRPLLAVVACTPLLACAASSALPAPLAPEPSHSDGDKYHVLYENECLRLLRYHDQPGEKTHQHGHPDFLLYALVPFERRLTFPDGSRRERRFQAGEAAFMRAQVHVGENIGHAPTDALLIEMKGCAKR
ncbi:MAG: hypothetical protein QM756_14610 [Polyangiaceae bacterium]